MRAERGLRVRAWALAITVALGAAAAVPSLGEVLHAERSTAAQAPSQVSQSGPSARFEVASIKPNPVGPAGPTSASVQPGGRYVATNMPLRLLIGQTYHIPASRLVGGPAWMESTHFDIDARANRELSPSGGDRPLDAALMSLLADRFKLRVHTETRRLAVYNLVLANRNGRLGPNLRASTRDCDAILAAMRGSGAGTRSGGPPLPPPAADAATTDAPPCGARNAPGLWVLDSQPLSYFASALAADTGLPVVDKTGLSGRYNLRLAWTPDQAARDASGAPDSSPVALDDFSLATALRQQLGLRLEKSTGPVEFLVIDSVERPAPN